MELPDGVTAWWCQSIGEGRLNLKKIQGDVVPALTPVLLAYEGTGTLYLSPYEGLDPGSATDYEGNLFKGSVDPGGHNITASEMMTNFLTLGRPSGDDSYDNFGFYAYHPKNNILPSYVAWLAMNDVPQQSRMTLHFDDPTAVGEIQDSMVNGQWSMDEDVWYDLNGRRLMEKPTKSGLYIHGGKKVVI